MSPRNETQSAIPWHARSADAAIEELATRPEGLMPDEAAQRLAGCGPNRLRPPQARGPLVRLLAQFHNVLIYVLLGAGVITAALRHWIDAAVILGVVVINAVVGFIQEGKAERALDAIRDMLSPERDADARRPARVTLPAEDIVPGDIVLLQSGDKVPADLRLIRARGLQIQEAVLTGESLPVEKATAPVDEAAALGDRSSMAYSGTLVTRGQAQRHRRWRPAIAPRSATSAPCSAGSRR